MDPRTAAMLLAGCERIDPRGIAIAADLDAWAARGLCFAASHNESGSQAAYVLDVHRGQAWVQACRGDGLVDWTRTLLPHIERQAAALQLQDVAFQTSRRGLVHKSEALGYQVTGWIMRKGLR